MSLLVHWAVLVEPDVVVVIVILASDTDGFLVNPDMDLVQALSRQVQFARQTFDFAGIVAVQFAECEDFLRAGHWGGSYGVHTLL